MNQIVSDVFIDLSKQREVYEILKMFSICIVWSALCFCQIETEQTYENQPLHFIANMTKTTYFHMT